MRIRFLGTGAAEGIPAIGCKCDHCTRARQEGGRFVRQRTSVLFSLDGYELLMDTPPDIRGLLDANGVRQIDGIFLTHEHFDHAAGLEEFLYWSENVDLFAEPRVYQRLIREDWGDRLPEIAFHIAFRPGAAIRFNDFFFTPFEVRHSVPCFGAAFYEGRRRIVHAADSDSRLSNYARCLIDGADLLIVNTPFFEPRADQAHLSVQEAVALKDELGVKQLILTHFNHYNRPHDDLESYASQFEGVTVAFDGLTILI
jgi:phosphoribosyl 1,2-cyclic phosphate phosphodiesterase